MLKLTKRALRSLSNVYDVITAFNVDPWINGKVLDKAVHNKMIKAVSDAIDGEMETFEVPVYKASNSGQYEGTGRQATVVHHTYGQYHTVIVLHCYCVNAGASTPATRAERKMAGTPNASLLPLLMHYNACRDHKYKFNNDRINCRDGEVWVMPAYQTWFWIDQNEDTESEIKEVVEGLRSGKYVYTDAMRVEFNTEQRQNFSFKYTSDHDYTKLEGANSKEQLVNKLVEVMARIYSNNAHDHEGAATAKTMDNFTLSTLSGNAFDYPEDYIGRIDSESSWKSSVNLYFRSIGRVEIEQHYTNTYKVSISYVYIKSPTDPSITQWKSAAEPYKTYKNSADEDVVKFTYPAPVLNCTQFVNTGISSQSCEDVNAVIEIINKTIKKVRESWNETELKFVEQKVASILGENVYAKL